jgi:adenylate cyclase
MLKNLAEFVFGARLDRRLPDRVSHSIAEQQIKSEILIGWVQLTLVLFFGTLYTIAPKTSAGTGFTPVPWALALYFLLTVLRLAASYRHFLPRWLLMASVVMDMGLLMLLIWSFHLQYEQPASFYLKAPTMLYVFIFIALRALRFDATYIIFAGATAAVGWLALNLSTYSSPSPTTP